MKKMVSAIMVLALSIACIFSFAGCSKAADKFNLVLITDGASVTDGGYNESAWNGVKAYGDENKKTYRYYQPSLNEDGELEDEIISRYVDLAVKDGAESIILPGEVFASALCKISAQYKDVQFVLVDAEMDCDDDTHKHDNVADITFDNLQAGYLAGYASVALGNKKLGYFGSVDDASTDYGAGYVQGAAKAADESAIPVILDYAEFDSDSLTYDYSFTIKPVYTKISDSEDKIFKVNVIDGYGSGAYADGENVTVTAYPAPEGKVFDHWECKSDTDGVRDGKVNISSKSEPSMNLLVGDCDCTIKAVWADAVTYPVTVGEEITYAPENSKITVNAPAAQSGMVFDHWECDEESALSDVTQKSVEVSVTDHGLTLTPVYVESEKPTFDVTVLNGTGTGSYLAGDSIQVIAEAPKDGYMFYKWENVDNQGKLAGIAMENEYDYVTSFEMVDRYAAVVEEMYDKGTQIVFAGGNPVADSVFTANGSFDYPLYTFGYGVDHGGDNNCVASVVNDYGAAVKYVLSDFKAGTTVADCSNNCIYVSGMNTEEYYTDDEGKKQKNSDYNAGYAKVYKALADGKIKVTAFDSNPSKAVKTKCLTVNYWSK